MVSENKHTPGPWSYGHLGTEALWIGPDHNQTPVAHVYHDMEYARDNSRANARLIAAAPEMLEALPDLSHVISWLENGCDPASAAKELRIYQGRIERAKAKAEGRS